MTDIGLRAQWQIAQADITMDRYIKTHFPDGTWHGDTCGCPDPHCIDNHHEPDEPCDCLPTLIDELRTNR